ncbi:MAG TPA: DUF922 domain-containing protein [Polyangiaceae bacterium]|nr:DUF922 domain-containing protein [Polyangiaceae bacterium]
MRLRPTDALAVLVVAALVACGKADDSGDDDDAGAGGETSGGSAGKGGASGRGGTGAGVGGAAAGHSAQGGATSGSAGSATSGSTGAGSAGRSSNGGAAGAAGSGVTAGGGGASGSVALGGGGGSSNSGGSGGRGGEAASAGSSELGGAGGEPDGPSRTCEDPLDTVDVSRLEASEAFEPYTVTGSTANQIRQSINQNRGMDYDAYTSWYVGWQYDDCDGNGLVVTANVTYQYPEWTPPASDATELSESWDTYMDALFCHEYGHAKNGLDCANDVFTALSAIDAGGDCSKLLADAEAEFQAIIDEYNARDIQYDADTDHGATMGARFPP